MRVKTTWQSYIILSDNFAHQLFQVQIKLEWILAYIPLR